MQDVFDKLTSRHIAKLLSRLGDTVAPIQISEIKRQMRFLSEDLKKVDISEVSADERMDKTTSKNV